MFTFTEKYITQEGDWNSPCFLVWPPFPGNECTHSHFNSYSWFYGDCMSRSPIMTTDFSQNGHLKKSCFMIHFNDFLLCMAMFWSIKAGKYKICWLHNHHGHPGGHWENPYQVPHPNFECLLWVLSTIIGTYFVFLHIQNWYFLTYWLSCVIFIFILLSWRCLNFLDLVKYVWSLVIFN